MRIPRIYCPEKLTTGASISVGNERAHYLLNVLRLDEGRPVILFDGNGGEFTGQVLNTQKKSLQISVDNFSSIDRISSLSIHLAIGVSKGDRMDWTIQKATELGVTSISPLFTVRSEVKLSGHRLEKKLSHWQQVMISACEQSGRNRLTEISTAKSLPDWLPRCDAEQKWVLHHRSDKTLNASLNPNSVALLIGPEGGLDEQEISQAEQAGFQPLTLGPRVLRTETAPLAAISIMQSYWGDFL